MNEDVGNPTLSLVVPMFNEAVGISHFYEHVCKVLSTLGVTFEIVCVNDGSTDDTLHLLRALNARDCRVKVIDLSRNYGKELALSAGIDHARGQAVIPIDADLQDPPEVITELVVKWREGYEVVLAQRVDRSVDSYFKRNSAALYYKVIGRLSEVPIPPNVGDFRLMDRKVVDALKTLPERARFMKGLFAWLGFRQAVIPYIRASRATGKSKWKFWKLWNFAIEGLVSFTSVPLKIWSYLGMLISLLSILYIVFILLQVLIFGIDVPGYASIFVALLFFSGLNMIGLGILGEYVSRIFIEVKQRPLYIVREYVGIEKN